MPDCCRGLGQQPLDRLLARVRALVDLPEGAQMYAATDGRKWRIVDRLGNEPTPPVGSKDNTIALLSAPELTLVMTDQGYLVTPLD